MQLRPPGRARGAARVSWRLQDAVGEGRLRADAPETLTRLEVSCARAVHARISELAATHAVIVEVYSYMTDPYVKVVRAPPAPRHERGKPPLGSACRRVNAPVPGALRPPGR
ncbi:hypothetical protein GCM10023238_32380 [Streptomyces heliomycini]